MRLLFILSVAFYSCSNDPKALKEFIQPENNIPIEKIESARILHTENGVLKVEIIAKTINRFKEVQPQLLFSNGIEVIFYADSARITSVLKANNASVNEVDNIMIASESVVLTSSDGKRLETDELIWDENKNKVYTDEKVFVITSKEVIEGKGFTSNPDFTEYSISKIHGIFNFENPTN